MKDLALMTFSYGQDKLVKRLAKLHLFELDEEATTGYANVFTDNLAIKVYSVSGFSYLIAFLNMIFMKGFLVRSEEMAQFKRMIKPIQDEIIRREIEDLDKNEEE